MEADRDGGQIGPMRLLSYISAAILLLWIAFGVWGTIQIIQTWGQEREVYDALSPEPKTENTEESVHE